MTSGTLLLGIDIGTSSSKGVLCTPDGRVLETTSVAHTTSFPRPGWAEHDADAVWWHDLVTICRRLLASRYTGDDVAGVAVSAIGPCLLPVDADGKPLRPGILYGIDTRAAAEIAWLNARFGEPALLDLGGMALTSQAIGPKILWLRRHEPEIFARTAMVHSASDYLVFRLTGEHVMDRHTASYVSPLFAMDRLAWDERFSEPVIPLTRLPRLLDATEIAGQVTPAAGWQTGLRTGTLVTASTMDAAAEAVSVGIVNPGDMMIMYGSTLFLLNLVAAPCPDRRLWTTLYSLPHLHAVTGGMATSGLLTTWFRDVAGESERRRERETGENAYVQLATAAAAIPAGCDGLVCLPYFAGERTPLHDPDARGVFAGLTLRHTRGHLYRAVLESTGYSVRHHLEIMNEMNASPTRVVAVGGGAQSDLWLQVVSDIAGLRQDVPERIVGASYGDAFLAGLATGRIPDLTALNGQWVRMARQIEPDGAQAACYDDHYRVFRDLYTQTRDDVHRLAALAGRE